MNPLENRQLYTFGHITPENWLCPCCNTANIHPDLLEAVWQFWRETGNQWKMTSVYRCPKHNAAVGGVNDSYHTIGMAADFRPTKRTAPELAVMAFTTIGWAEHGLLLEPEKGIIHFDLRPQPAALVQTKQGWAPLWPWIREHYPHLPCPQHQTQSALRLAAPSEPALPSLPDSPSEPPQQPPQPPA